MIKKIIVLWYLSELFFQFLGAIYIHIFNSISIFYVPTSINIISKYFDIFKVQ